MQFFVNRRRRDAKSERDDEEKRINVSPKTAERYVRLLMPCTSK
jgi:hypothetical protein